MAAKLQIVVADDHTGYRAGVAQALGAEVDMVIVGQGGSAAEAIDLTQAIRPDLVLLDIKMPGGGLEAARTIAATCPATRIVMLTSSEAEEDLRAARAAGAHGYLLKGVPARELVRVVRAVGAGERSMPPHLFKSFGG